MNRFRNIFFMFWACVVILYMAGVNICAQDASQNNAQLPETVAGSEVFKQELSPQVQQETQKPEPVANESKAVKKAEPVDSVKKEDKKPATVGEDKSQKDATKGLKVDNKSLLSITDGAFRYSRIPGITIKENNEQIIAKVEEVKHDIETGEKGLFGLSKKASDRLAKIILIIIIAIVFILYRMRTKSTTSSVLRRFPK